jgi:hypothetical protein
VPDPYKALVRTIDALAKEAHDLRNSNPEMPILASKDNLLLNTTILSATQALVDALENNTAALHRIAGELQR